MLSYIVVVVNVIMLILIDIDFLAYFVDNKCFSLEYSS